MSRLLQGVLALLILTAAACGSTMSPSSTFDAYFEAYAAGDSEQLWALSSTAARADASRVKRELLAGLRSGDGEERTHFEGTFGVTAEVIEPMDERQFFDWAVAMIRRRLGAGYVRAFVTRVQRVREETLPDGSVVIVYRADEDVSRLPLSRTSDGWRVDQSPFPQPPSGGAPVTP